MMTQLRETVSDRFNDQAELIFPKPRADFLATIPKPKLLRSSTAIFHPCFSDADLVTLWFQWCGLTWEHIQQNVVSPSKMHLLIDDKRRDGKLVRWNTMNLDGLESRGGARIYNGTGRRKGGQEKSGDLTMFDVVQLHGGLNVVWCNNHEHVMEMTTTIAAAMARGQRLCCPQCPLQSTYGRPYAQAGILRPGIVLYNETHPLTISIGEFVQRVLESDLKSGVDLFFIVGTSLKVFGATQMVKNVAKELRRGRKANTKRMVLMVNNTGPPTILEGSIDIFVHMDCEQFATEVCTSAGGSSASGQERRPDPINETVDQRTRIRQILLGGSRVS